MVKKIPLEKDHMDQQQLDQVKSILNSVRRLNLFNRDTVEPVYNGPV